MRVGLPERVTVRLLESIETFGVGAVDASKLTVEVCVADDEVT